MVPDKKRSDKKRTDGKGADRKRIACWALTERGVQLALSIAEKTAVSALYVPDRFTKMHAGDILIGFSHFSSALKTQFHEFDAHLFVMASGIVVRAIASLIQDKTTDPAVMVADEAGQHVISLTSGHLGGANALTLEMAFAIDAQPVISTATDLNGILALDAVAQKIGAVVENRGMIKKTSVCMLSGVPVALVCDRDLYERFYGHQSIRPDYYDAIDETRLTNYEAACIITEKTIALPQDILQKTLLIRPPTLVLGIGCNKDTPEKEIADAVAKVFCDHALSFFSVVEVATVDQKREEPGLVAYARVIGRKLTSYPAEVLDRVEDPGMSPPSAHAQKHVGAKGVAEPAALQSAGTGAWLMVPKQKIGNVTVAVAKKGGGWAENKPGKLLVVGIGPGGDDYMTRNARRMIQQSEVIAGYHKYIEHVKPFIAGKDVISTGMAREIDRVDAAIQSASQGNTVSLVCSGDAGIYGLAGLVYERMDRLGVQMDTEISPGVTAAAAAASLLGAPLTNDFVTLSLSDLLTPTEVVEKRIAVAASADMVTAVYNPVSKKRTVLIRQLQTEFLKYRKGNTPVGIVTHALRGGQRVEISTLDAFLACTMNMNSVIIVGNSDTKMIDGHMVTRRGYERK